MNRSVGVITPDAQQQQCNGLAPPARARSPSMQKQNHYVWMHQGLPPRPVLEDRWQTVQRLSYRDPSPQRGSNTQTNTVGFYPQQQQQQVRSASAGAKPTSQRKHVPPPVKPALAALSTVANAGSVQGNGSRQGGTTPLATPINTVEAASPFDNVQVAAVPINRNSNLTADKVQRASHFDPYNAVEYHPAPASRDAACKCCCCCCQCHGQLAQSNASNAVAQKSSLRESAQGRSASARPSSAGRKREGRPQQAGPTVGYHPDQYCPPDGISTKARRAERDAVPRAGKRTATASPSRIRTGSKAAAPVFSVGFHPADLNARRMLEGRAESPERPPFAQYRSDTFNRRPPRKIRSGPEGEPKPLDRKKANNAANRGEKVPLKAKKLAVAPRRREPLPAATSREIGWPYPNHAITRASSDDEDESLYAGRRSNQAPPSSGASTASIATSQGIEPAMKKKSSKKSKRSHPKLSMPPSDLQSHDSENQPHLTSPPAEVAATPILDSHDGGHNGSAFVFPAQPLLPPSQASGGIAPYRPPASMQQGRVGVMSRPTQVSYPTRPGSAPPLDSVADCLHWYD